MVKPEHEFYQETMAGVVHLDQPVYSIPDFIEHFWTSRDQTAHRIWLLKFLKDGIRKKEDMSVVSYYYALEQIINAMVNADRNYYLR